MMGPLLPWAGSSARVSFVSAHDTPLEEWPGSGGVAAVEWLGSSRLQDPPTL